jgi:hypothetical protein
LKRRRWSAAAAAAADKLARVSYGTERERGESGTKTEREEISAQDVKQCNQREREVWLAIAC